MNKQECIVKDLGRVIVNDSGRKERKLIVRCSECEINREVYYHIYIGSSTKTTKCRSCANWQKRHMETNTKLYKKWSMMKERVSCPETKGESYRNVTICKEWIESYESFRDWALENGYKENLELDKDVMCDYLCIKNKIYSPDTCIWITKRRNIQYSYKNNRVVGRFSKIESCGILEVTRKNGNKIYSLTRKSKYIGMFQTYEDALNKKKEMLINKADPF